LALASGLWAGPPPPNRFSVDALPGYVDGSGNPLPLPSKMYTGYINAGTPPSGVGSMYFHYWMVEAEHKPQTAPVIIWYNGGPGASSLFGMFQEFGPLLLTEESMGEQYLESGIPTPIFNPWRWSATHTLVAIDSPPPMGLSFCSEHGPTGGPTSCGPWTDKTVFAANHAAHKAFFTEIFPGLKENPVFFAGESYGGMYVPGFVNAMLDDPVPGLNLQGFMVGDGFPGCAPLDGKPADWCINLSNVGTFRYPNANPGPWYDVEFFHGHQQISNELYREIMKECPEDMLKGDEGKVLDDKCSALVDRMAAQVGPFSVYNLFDECPEDQPSPTPSPQFRGDKHGLNQALRSRRKLGRKLQQQHQSDGDSGLSSPCLANAMPAWFAHKETLKAIGAPDGIAFINLDNGIGFNYTTDQTFVGPIYTRALEKGLRVLMYEGDNDACGLSSSPNEDKFFQIFGAALNRTRDWSPWTCGSAQEQHVAGFVTEWGQPGKLPQAQFVSVRGAGHMVPLNRPQASAAMVQGFTHKEGFPVVGQTNNNFVV